MAEALIQAIKVDLAQIDLLLTTHTSLIDRVQQQSPDVVELAALATVLHSYYNGIESIFLAIARLLDRQLRPVHAMFHEEIEVFLNFLTRRTDES